VLMKMPLLQKLGGPGGGFGKLGGDAGENDFPAFAAAIGAHFHAPVRLFDDLKVVFDQILF